MSKNISFKISIEKIVIEYEGDEETGENLQAGISQLVNNITNAPSMLLQPNSDSLDGNVVRGTATALRLPTTRRTRSGTSATKLINGLIDSNFFSDRRNLSDVSNELIKKGHTIKSNRIADVLQKFTQQNLLQREKNEEGNFVYWNING